MIGHTYYLFYFRWCWMWELGQVRRMMIILCILILELEWSGVEWCVVGPLIAGSCIKTTYYDAVSYDLTIL